MARPVIPPDPVDAQAQAIARRAAAAERVTMSFLRPEVIFMPAPGTYKFEGDNMKSKDDDGEVFAYNEHGYNGVDEPVQIEEVEHTDGPAVIIGAIRQDGHVITADSRGVLVVESAIPPKGKSHST